MNNLQTRILVGVVGIPLVLGVIWLGGWWFACLIMTISAVGIHEYYSLASHKNASPSVGVGIGFGLAMQACITMAFVGSSLPALIQFVMLALLLFATGVLATITTELYRAKENAVLNTSVTVMGVAYVSLPMIALVVLRSLKWPMIHGSFADAGAALVLTLFVCIWACDSAAYFVGLAIGKHKLFPRVSPKKSWEGAIAGFCASVLTFWLFGTAMMSSLPVGIALGAGALIGVVGQIGDLAESLLKRDAGVKDSSSLIPGHGGVLDRFDSILFGAPALLLYLFLISW